MLRSVDPEPLHAVGTPAAGERALARISVLVAEADGLTRYGIVRALSDDPGYLVAGEAADGSAAIDAIETLSPDVVVVGDPLPVTATSALIARFRDSPVRFVVVGPAGGRGVHEAIASGAVGFLHRAAGPEELRLVVASAAHGESWLSPVLQQELVREIRSLAGRVQPTLTTREREVVALLADGLQAAAIAQRLKVSPSSIKKYQRALYEKLGVENAPAAVATSLRLGLIA